VTDYFSVKHLMMINESKILELINRHKDTGLTIKAFCANEGIPKSSYYYWRRKLRKEPGKRFIPLLVNNTTAKLGVALFPSLSLKA
jgi:transposase-like protein